MYLKNIKLTSITFLFCFSLISCKKEKDIIIMVPATFSSIIDTAATYKELFRSQFHFSPQKNWMNDPNGMVFYKGKYHLFYQYYPNDIVWGPMHWGHATSSDLILWKHQKIALFPDQLGLIFSGSAIVDIENTSGLGTKENPPMIAIFTYHNMDGEKAKRLDFQTQGLAYSLDEGITWTKYSGNPIINNPGIKDFRDPKVSWNPESQLWNLTLVAGNCAKFYTSKNLLKWNFESDFGKNTGAHGGVWECPDLFKLKVEDSNEKKWVLLVSVNPGAPKGGSGTQYFIGDYDGKHFTTSQKNSQWIDQGTDNYAGVTYNNAPNNQHIFIGWMSNWQYGIKTPTKKWRSAMTLPRNLSLAKINDSYVLKSKPIQQLNNNLIKAYVKDNVSLQSNQKAIINYPNLNQSKIDFIANASDLKMVFSNEVNDSLVLNYNQKQKEFSIDRTHSGVVNFDSNFGNSIQKTTVSNCNTNTMEYSIIMDWSSIEIFLNGGVYCFTDLIFPNKPYTKLTIQSKDNQEIKNLKINCIKSIW